MTRAALAPARSAMSAIRVSQRPRSLMTRTAARRICLRRASESLRCAGIARQHRLNGRSTSTTMSQTNTYDAIVIGGGHNGLVASAYLSRAGARTVVLEARGITGGAAATEAPWPEAPELKVTKLSYVISLMPPTIGKDLELKRHGPRL